MNVGIGKNNACNFWAGFSINNIHSFYHVSFCFYSRSSHIATGCYVGVSLLPMNSFVNSPYLFKYISTICRNVKSSFQSEGEGEIFYGHTVMVNDLRHYGMVLSI